MKSFFKVMILAGACLLLSTAAFAQWQTFTVDAAAAPGGTSYPTLTAAIATATAYPGGPHVIEVKAGTYYEYNDNTTYWTLDLMAQDSHQIIKEIRAIEDGVVFECPVALWQTVDFLAMFRCGIAAYGGTSVDINSNGSYPITIRGYNEGINGNEPQNVTYANLIFEECVTAIKMRQTLHTDIHDVTISNGGIGILVEDNASPSDDVAIGPNVTVTTMEDFGIYYHNSINGTIDGCVVSDIATSGIMVMATGGIPGYGTTVSNCETFDCGGNGIVMTFQAGGTVTANTVHECAIDNTLSAADNFGGIAMAGTGTITGNTTYNNGDGAGFCDYGIAVDNLGNALGGDINIGDNCLFGHVGVQGLDGVDLAGPSTSNTNWWHGNYYSDHQGAASYVLDGLGGSTDWSPFAYDNSAVFATATSPIEIWDEVDIDVAWTIPGCSELDDATLGAYEITFDYDETKFEFVSAAYNMLSLTEEDAFFGQTNEAEGALYTGIAVNEVAGTITFAATNFSNPKAGDGIMASLTFQAIATGAATDFTIGSTYLDGDADPMLVTNTPLAAVVEDGTVPVIETLVVDDVLGDNTFGTNYDMAISGTVSDNYDLFRVWYQFDGAGGWNTVGNVDGVADVYGDPTPFVVNLALITGDGTHTLNLRVRDQSGNYGYHNHDFTLDNTGPEATDVMVVDSDGCADAGFTSTELCDVSWTDDGSAVEMELALAGFPVPFVAYENATTYTFASTEGAYTLHVRLKDAYGNAGGYSGGTSVTLDMTAPAPSAAVTVPATITGSATFSGDCNLDAASGALYAGAVLGTVAPDCGEIVDLISGLGSSPRFDFEIDPVVDGSYDVTFASMDAAGNVGFVSTTIELDATAPEFDAFSVADVGGSDCSEGWTVAVTVEWSADDVMYLNLGSVTGVHNVQVDISAETSPYTHNYILTNPPRTNMADNYVFGTLEDAVANEGAEASDFVFVDRTNPTVGTLVLNGANSTWTANPIVSVDLAGWSTDVDEIFMSLVSGDYSSALVEPFAAATTFDFGAPAEDTWVYLYAEGEDCADRRTSEASGRVAFDLTDPILSDVVINGGAVATNNATLTIDFTWTESHMQTVHISENADMSGAVAEAWAGGPTYSFDVALGDGTKDVYVQLEDFVGRKSTIEMSTIELDGAFPLAGTMVFTSGNPLAVEGYTNSLSGNSFAWTTPDSDIYRIQVRNLDNSPSTGWLYTGPWTGALPLLDDPGSCGPITIEWVVTDLAMNQSVFTGTFEYCPTMPAAPSNAAGDPGASVMLTWDAVPDAQLYHIRYDFGGEYPIYGSGTPPNPGTRLAGIFEAETADNFYLFDGPQMDLYAFGIWTLSNHGVWSDDVTPNQEIVEHNYRLGDMMDHDENPGADGCLSFDPEFVLLAVCYNTAFGDAFFNDEFDFSPIDSDPTGIADPDGDVDFDDLVIFALNYDWSRNEETCEGLKSSDGAAASVFAEVTVSAEVPAFVRSGDEFTVPISISEDAVAGYHLTFDYPANFEVVSVIPGSAYDNSDKMFFYHDENAANLDISSVVLSEGFEAGEVAVVTFRATATGRMDLEEKVLDVRDWENGKAEVKFDLASKGGSMPTEFGLSQNYPNPFNPTTTVELAMPVAGQYKLTIFNVIGQVVRVFEGHSDAGFVTFNWDASEQSSGVYLYRVEAGSFSDVRKMILLK